MKKKAVIALLATVLVFGATAQAEDAYDDGEFWTLKIRLR